MLMRELSFWPDEAKFLRNRLKQKLSDHRSLLLRKSNRFISLFRIFTSAILDSKKARYLPIQFFGLPENQKSTYSEMLLHYDSHLSGLSSPGFLKNLGLSRLGGGFNSNTYLSLWWWVHHEGKCRLLPSEVRFRSLNLQPSDISSVPSLDTVVFSDCQKWCHPLSW